MARLRDFFEEKRANTQGRVEFSMTSLARERLVRNLNELLEMIDPPPLYACCMKPTKHAPGCQCMNLA